MKKEVDEKILSYQFEFKVIGPLGKVVGVETVKGSGETEGEAIAAARAAIDKKISEDQIVQYTGKFIKL